MTTLRRRRERHRTMKSATKRATKATIKIAAKIAVRTATIPISFPGTVISAGSAGWRSLSLNEVQNEPGLVKPGMVFVLSAGAGNGHTGLVERVDGVVLTTIEGNTNTGGSREGSALYAAPVAGSWASTVASSITCRSLNLRS